ncbi:MAG: hypothetical protein IT428_23175 [Planctomycetaceae bacterium]|nr:hypothetical protein [Planctomycetaceae bacterium]
MHWQHMKLVSLEPLFLLAARSGSTGSFSASWVVGTAVAVSIVWLVIFYGDRIRAVIHAQTNPVENVFDRLCEAHQLDRSEKEFLTRLAESERLTKPALVFVDPAPLRRSVDGGGAASPAASSLLKKLFEATPTA